MKIYKEIAIKTRDHKIPVRCVVPVVSDAIIHYELMTSHYIKLSFLSKTPIYFETGDYVETEYGRFELLNNVKPKEDGMAFSYDIQFDAYYRKWANKMLRYRPNHSSSEVNFVLTNSIVTHANILLDNLTYLATQSKAYLYDEMYTGAGTDYVCAFDSTIDTTKQKVISYNEASILDAISNIAQTFECEWWIEGNIIHFGTCENENAVVDFRIGENISSMDDSKSQNSYANRVYAFGSDKNLPYSYGQDASADITKYGVVQRRLMLPTTNDLSSENRKLLADNNLELKRDGCIQEKGYFSEDQYIEGVYVNDDIYPQIIVMTQKISSYEKDVEQENNDGTKTYIKRKFYRLEDLFLVDKSGNKTGDFDFRKAYIIEGKTLHILFQSGSLNGLDFECAFNPDGESETTSKAQMIEVVANDSYGFFLPEGTMIPKEGDMFVLYNFDATKFIKTLVVAASNELLADTVRNIKKSMIDPTTFTCIADDNYTYNNGRGRIHGVGDRVNLYNKAYFASYRQSRIIGYEIKLDIPFDGLKYIVGDKPTYSRLNNLEKKVNAITVGGNITTSSSGSGNSIYIIKSYDSTQPTEGNVFSAKAVDEQRLRRDKDDTAQGTITFEKLQRFLQGVEVGGYYGIDKDGKAIVDTLQSFGFSEEEQRGLGFTKSADGKIGLSLTNLTIWGKAIFHELEIRKMSYVGGNMVFSPAGSVIFSVKEVSDGWRCYLLTDDGTTATENLWEADDQARCKTFDIIEGVHDGVGNRDYWRRVVRVSTEAEYIYAEDGVTPLYDGKRFSWIELSLTDCADGSDAPQAGDAIVLMGNRTKTERQNLVVKEVYGDNAPSETGYRGVNSYSLEGKLTYTISPNKVYISSAIFSLIAGDGQIVKTPIYVGDWVDGQSYGYYDEVSHLGTRWLCIVPDGQTTTEEPRDGATYWKATTAIQHYILAIDVDGQQTLDWGESIMVRCHVYLGDELIDTSDGWTWAVSRDSGEPTDDAAWNNGAKAHAFNGSILLAYKEDDNDLGSFQSAPYGTIFTFTARKSGTTVNVVNQLSI